MAAFLTGDRIILRAPEPSDLDCMYRWENDTDLWTYGSNHTPLSRQLLYDYINSYDGDIYRARQLRLMIVLKESGLPIGTLDLTDFDPRNHRAEVGILIDAEHTRQRYASESLSLLDSYAHECLGIHQLWCIVATDNLPARSLFTSAGYKSTGRLESWLCRNRSYSDAYIMQRIFQ